jgi:hypothetical protein
VGEARRRLMNGQPPGLNHAFPLDGPKRVRLVTNIQIQELESEGLMVMVLGDRHDALAMQMRPQDARKLAEALTKHADHLEQTVAPRIIPASRIITA